MLRKIAICLCALLCMLTFAACKDEQGDSDNTGETPSEAVAFSPELPEYSYVSIYHYKKDGEGMYESLDDCVHYRVGQDSETQGIWWAITEELEGTSFLPDPSAEFDYGEHYDINFYTADGRQYALSFSVNGVCDVEKQKCRVASGALTFERLAEYYNILS